MAKVAVGAAGAAAQNAIENLKNASPFESEASPEECVAPLVQSLAALRCCTWPLQLQLTPNKIFNAST